MCSECLLACGVAEVLSRAEIEERLAAYALEKTKAVEEEDFDAVRPTGRG